MKKVLVALALSCSARPTPMSTSFQFTPAFRSKGVNVVGTPSTSAGGVSGDHYALTRCSSARTHASRLSTTTPEPGLFGIEASVAGAPTAPAPLYCRRNQDRVRRQRDEPTGSARRSQGWTGLRITPSLHYAGSPERAALRHSDSPYTFSFPAERGD